MSEAQLRIDRTRVTWREIDDEVVALDIEHSEYLSLNPSGSLLWRALLDGATRTVLIGLLATEFDLDEAVAAGDVDAFLATCIARGLVAGP